MWRWAMVLGAMALWHAPSALAQGSEYAQIRAAALYRQLEDPAQCEMAAPEARRFWASSDFTTLSVGMQAEFLHGLIGCAWRLEDGRAAIAAAEAAKAIDAPWADYFRMQLGVRFDDDAVAVAGFEDTMRTRPRAFEGMEQRTIWMVLRAARRLDASGARELAIHDALEANNYLPADGEELHALHLEHARLLLERGDLQRARSRAADVDGVSLLLDIRIDKRFAPLRADPAFGARLDLAAAAERELVRLRERAEDDPRRLGTHLRIAQTLRALGRNEEALTGLDAIIASAQAPNAYKDFDDHADMINWLLNEKAYVLYALNRPDEARAAFGESIAVGENGQWSVSQVINFASMLEAEGRPRDALEVLQTLGRASPYGDMWAAASRACAAEQLGDTAVRDEAMTFLVAHEDDNPAALSRAYLCVNNLEGAAALFVRRLNDPTHRGGALQALQIFREETGSALTRLPLLRQRLAQVRSRPEVIAAVDSVGRIEEIPLYPVYWGDL